MSPDPPADGRRRRREWAAVALPAVAGALAVGLAATGAGLLLPGADPGDAATNAIRAGGAALVAAGLVALLTPLRGPARVPLRTLPSVLATAAAALAAVTALTFGFSPASVTTPEPQTTTTTTAPTTTTTERGRTTTTQADRGEDDPVDSDGAPLLAALIALGVLALLAYALVQLVGLASLTRWWRPGPQGSVTPGSAVPLDAQAAEAGLEASLADALAADRAPRDAIGDAYARLLAALHDAGAGRHPHEAPHEHLHRVLSPLGVRSAPLHRLAELFVLARFSQHPVTDRHRDDATGALREALADLRAAEVRRAAETTTAGVAP